MAKRLSENQKTEIIELFNSGKTIEELSYQFECTKLTISRNLKKNIGEKNYKELISKNRSHNNFKKTNKQILDNKNENVIKNASFEENTRFETNLSDVEDEKYLSEIQFTEIIPLNFDIENTPQKDLSSIPISEMSFPKVVYMVVDKKIELEIKTLNDYPDWQFLSDDELKRKTIEIFLDLKIAKSHCRNDQKVIKVPNTKVFELAAPILNSRGISRIVSDNRLIAL